MLLAPGATLLKRQTGLLVALLVGFVLLFGAQSWRAEKADQVHHLQTVMELSEKAIDRYFVKIEAAMSVLAREVAAAGGEQNLADVQLLLKRFNELHPEATSVSFLRIDGQVLAASNGAPPQARDFPNLATEPTYQHYLAELTPQLRMQLGRPLFGQVSQRWVFPVRYVVRDALQRPTAVLTLSMPVEFLEEFWRKAPVAAKATIGLIRDDGYLLSRYPVPAALGHAGVYGGPRSGALVQHLKAEQFPTSGYVEGINELAGTAFGNAFIRLEHFPVTLFVAMPKAEYYNAFWRRVRVPYLLVALLAAIGAYGYRSALRRQRSWDEERQHNTSLLRESDREQRFLINHLLAGVIVHGPDGGVLQVNAQACLLLGLSEAEMLGKVPIDPTWRFVREDNTPMPVDEYPVPRVLGTQAAQHGMVVGVLKAGMDDPTWLLGDAFPESDAQGQIRRVVVTFVDISPRRRIERVLAESESRFRMLYEHNMDGVLQTRPDGSILNANQAACRLFRTDEAGLRTLGRTGVTDPGDSRVGVLLAQRQRDGHARGEITMLRADGSRFEAEVASVLYTDPAGQPLTSMVVRDVTDRRRAEAAVAAKELAEEANRSKSEFMARMSHELRTPLNAILGFSEVLELDRQHALHPVQRQRLGHIREAGGHLLMLINDLLDLSRIESGTMRLNIDRVDVMATARDAVSEVATLAAAQGITMHCHGPDQPLIPVQGDRTRIKQVLLNLLSNAIKYNQPGGSVEVAIDGDPQQVRLTVRDTGMGMSPAQVQTLYQPFNRLGREHTGVEGTGIGLVVSRSLVELMGGHISVISEPGLGSEFVVVLPVATHVLLPAATEPPSRSVGGRREDPNDHRAA